MTAPDPTSDREQLHAVVLDAIDWHYGTDLEVLASRAVDAILARWRLVPVEQPTRGTNHDDPGL